MGKRLSNKYDAEQQTRALERKGVMTGQKKSEEVKCDEWAMKQRMDQYVEEYETVRRQQQEMLRQEELARMAERQRSMSGMSGTMSGNLHYNGSPLMWDVSQHCFLDASGRRFERYRSPDGRALIRPIGGGAPEGAPEEVMKSLQEAENKIKPVIHKSGHFPIDWMVEGVARANDSDFLVKIEASNIGLVVIGHDGDEYAQHELGWVMMEKAEINPLIPAIENIERQLRVVGKLKQAANG